MAGTKPQQQARPAVPLVQGVRNSVMVRHQAARGGADQDSSHAGRQGKESSQGKTNEPDRMSSGRTAYLFSPFADLSGLEQVIGYNARRIMADKAPLPVIVSTKA